jgi:hypothetical protein
VNEEQAPMVYPGKEKRGQLKASDYVERSRARGSSLIFDHPPAVAQDHRRAHRPVAAAPGGRALRLSCDFDRLGENCLDLFEQIIGFAHNLRFFSVDRSPMFANEA